MKLLGYETRVNATQLQVAIAILAGIEWMLEHPNRGVITAEEISHKYILRRCIPYWGNFFCREIISTGTSTSTSTNPLSTHVNYNDNDNYTIPANLIIDKL
jgi:homospermidine synthase